MKNVWNWLKRHALVVGCATLAPLFFAIFTWAEYGYFCDQGKDHGQQVCASFWSAEHLHDWIYNAASNWQSELFFGILLLVLLMKLENRSDKPADKGDT